MLQIRPQVPTGLLNKNWGGEEAWFGYDETKFKKATATCDLILDITVDVISEYAGQILYISVIKIHLFLLLQFVVITIMILAC